MGGFCLDYLLNDDSYRSVTILVRREPGITHPKLKIDIIDFDNLEKHADRITGQDIFCCLGTTIKKAGSQQKFRTVDFNYPVEIGKIGQENGAEQFLLISSIGANASSRNFYLRTKARVEKAISDLGYSGTQIFRPSVLVGNREEFRIGEKIGEVVLNLFSPILIGNFRKYRPIKARSVACAMIETAKSELPGLNIFESDQIQFFVDRLEKKRKALRKKQESQN